MIYPPTKQRTAAFEPIGKAIIVNKSRKKQRYHVPHQGTGSTMKPDAVPTDGIKSALVDTVMPLSLPPFATPMVSPESVIVTAVLGTSMPLNNVTTMEVAVDGAADATVGPPLKATWVAVTPDAKKPDGYINVILPSATTAPPTLGVNVIVASQSDFPAIRSHDPTEKDVFNTA